MKQLTIFVLAVFFYGQAAIAQSLSKTGVMSVQLRNTGPIIQNEQVMGYYYFYNLEKQDRKNNNYLLTVVDENLREISSVNIVRPTTYLLVDGAFNGEAFGFLFYDARSRSVELVSYTKELKEAGKATKEIENKYAQAVFNMMAQGNPIAQPLFAEVDGKGFLFYGVEAGGKNKYEIEFYDNTMKKKWSITTTEDYNQQNATPAYQDSKYVASLITKRKNALSKDADFDLLVQTVDDGKKLFNIPLANDQYSLMLAELFYDVQKQTFTLFGEYYDADDKEMKSQSLGFMSMVVGIDGKVLSTRINSWKNEISKATPVNEKGKFEGLNANILFHDFIRTSDGSIFAVGEQYKKVASAAGITAAALGGSNISVSKINVYNMVIFEFTPDFTIKKVHLFEKDKNSTELPGGAAYYSSKMLSYIAKSYGGFDYSFTQPSKDKSTFVVAYVNYDREKGEKAKNVLGSVIYTPEKTFTVDKLALNRKSSDYFVHRAKEGYVLVTEYFRKEKRLDSRLEKLNY